MDLLAGLAQGQNSGLLPWAKAAFWRRKPCVAESHGEAGRRGGGASRAAAWVAGIQTWNTYTNHQIVKRKLLSACSISFVASRATKEIIVCQLAPGRTSPFDCWPASHQYCHQALVWLAGPQKNPMVMTWGPYDGWPAFKKDSACRFWDRKKLPC